MTLLLEESEQKCNGLFRLFLLRPMARAIDQFADEHVGAGLFLHALERTWRLIHAPVAAAGQKQAWHVDGATGEQFLLASENTCRGHAIPLQAALESGAPVFPCIDGKRRVRQPAVGG